MVSPRVFHAFHTVSKFKFNGCSSYTWNRDSISLDRNWGIRIISADIFACRSRSTHIDNSSVARLSVHHFFNNNVGLVSRRPTYCSEDLSSSFTNYVLQLLICACAMRVPTRRWTSEHSESGTLSDDDCHRVPIYWRWNHYGTGNSFRFDQYSRPH